MTSIRVTLAVQEHPYYPADWFSAEQASSYCEQAGGVPFRATRSWCKQHRIEVSTTGHVRMESLAYYVQHWLMDREVQV